jgi:hypothetical protein
MTISARDNRYRRDWLFLLHTTRCHGPTRSNAPFLVHEFTRMKDFDETSSTTTSVLLVI